MPADIFIDQRRAWIAAHSGVFLSQKRRAELLAKTIRARTRSEVGARPDPHDDQVTPPLFFRTATTTTGRWESALAITCAVAAPLGWTLGKGLYLALVRLIPERLRAYPVAACLLAAAVCGLPLPMLYDPATHALSDTLVTPWMLVQLPAAFLAAGIYGVLEGWLAVDGSSDWWPLTPEAAAIDDDLLLDPGLRMPTVLDEPPAPVRKRIPPSLEVRTPQAIRRFPITVSALASTTVTAWYIFAVIETTLSV